MNKFQDFKSESPDLSVAQNEGEKLQLIVPENQSKIRLDKFLSQKFDKTTRSRLQKLISEAHITINGNPTKASHLILPHEKIEIYFPKPQQTEILAENIPLNIVYEDDYLLVVNKPAGMVVHPASGNKAGTLVNALLHHCKQLSGIGGVKRPGVVHRLDKDTSGLLVVAKEDYTHHQLSSQFSNRTTEREYYAIVWGNFRNTSGRIESKIARNTHDRTQMTVSEARGKKAITNYEVIKQYPLTSLLSVKLETGRTHQIRVHFSYRGHPVLGDQTYGGKQKQIISLNQKSKNLAMEILWLMPRQALHAKVLGFLHPVSKKYLRFDSELPLDMKNLVNYLEKIEL